MLAEDEVFVMPKRVRVQGDRFNGRVPPGSIYVGRAAPSLPGSPFANPYRVVDAKKEAVAVSVAVYSTALSCHPDVQERVRAELRGKDLACWCPLPEPGQPDLCHAAVLLDYANQPTDLDGAFVAASSPERTQNQ